MFSGNNMSTQSVSRLFLITIMFLGVGHGVSAAEKSPITVKKINDNVYVLLPEKGLGSNVGVVVSDSGVLLIDAMNVRPGSSEKLDTALKTITNKPVQFIINTHSHRDHTGANEFYEKRGATIISHENTLYVKPNEKYKLTYNNQWHVNDKLNMTFGRQSIIATTAISHTYNDLIVYLPQTNIVFMGDNFGTTWGPNSSDQADGVLERVIDKIDSNTIVVPGHGHLTNKQHLISYQTNSILWLDTLYSLADSGITSEKMLENTQLKQLVHFFSGGATSGGYVEPKNLIRRFKRTLENRPTAQFEIKNIKNYVGVHQLSNGDQLEVYSQDNFTYARIKGKFVTELHPVSTTRFDFLGWENGEHLKFTLNNDNSVSQIAFIQSTKNEEK